MGDTLAESAPIDPETEIFVAESCAQEGPGRRESWLRMFWARMKR